MKKIKITSLYLLFFLLTSGISLRAQIIDNYGTRLGIGFSNEYWNYENEIIANTSGWKDNSLGAAIFLNAGKKITKHISIRPEIGYIHKGFDETITLINMEGVVVGEARNNVNFHKLTFDLKGKISPLKTKLEPYILLGVRSEYLLAHTEFMLYNGQSRRFYNELFDQYHKFDFGAIIGFGAEWNEFLYVEIEYNPALSKSLKLPGITTKNRYLGISLGINISHLIN